MLRGGAVARPWRPVTCRREGCGVGGVLGGRPVCQSSPAYECPGQGAWYIPRRGALENSLWVPPNRGFESHALVSDQNK